MEILEFPDDVLVIVLSYLKPEDYLSFCRIQRSVYRRYRQDPLYWRSNTSETFRLPISPLLAADGPRWYWLYKRLKTQTQLYTWGQGVKGNLGPGRASPITRPLPYHPPNRPTPNLAAMIPPISHPSRPTPHVAPRIEGRPAPALRVPPRQPPREVFMRTSSAWPTEVHIPDEVGVIADLQCGGWSTTILSSAGKLYTVGSIDSLDGVNRGRAAQSFERLEYLTQSTSALHHFSSGRRHILALTDDGEIVSWDRVNAKGLKIFSRNGRDFGGRPARVAAGWNESSAYVPNVGIVYWTPVQNDHSSVELDGIHVKEKVIPQTARKQSETGVFEVLKHIVLEEFILYITSDSKLYACALGTDNPDQTEPSNPPFEVPGYSAEGRELKDVHGQFKRFGVFTATGEVLAGDVEYLKKCFNTIRQHPSRHLNSDDWAGLTDVLAARPRNVPALQHTNVIALAYGDYHYHALHANGRITSYGRDSQQCGSLGLSQPQSGGRFRGLRREHPNPRSDADLLPISNLRGRQIWFEPERKDWLQWLEAQLGESHLNVDGQSARAIFEDDPAKQAAFSEWIEQEGRHWDEGPPSLAGTSDEKPTDTTGDYANLGVYFPIAIAAAGWHSGALVLKDEDRAHEIRSKWLLKRQPEDDGDKLAMPGAFENEEPGEIYAWKKDGFPKVCLPDGFEMPGVGEPRPWRDGRPTMQDLGLSG